jgi:hypothetical protein
VTETAKQPILFVLSVDTEEQWDWADAFPQENFNVSNVELLPAFQAVCQKHGIRPTYFVDYAVAESDSCAHILNDLCQQDACEIGAHLHPWCNPPYYGDIGEAESHVVNLPISQVEAKLEALVNLLSKRFSHTPKAFRTGRWGINGPVMQLLVKYGFNVDSSVYPYYQNEYFSCHGAPEFPYWASTNNPLQQGSRKDIFEIPVTAGFNWKNHSLANSAHRTLAHPLVKWSRLVGMAWHTHLLRKSYLSPELTAVEDMLSLCKISAQRNAPLIHMFLHSSSLVDNPNSLIGNNNAFEYITSSISKVVTQLEQDYSVRFCTISEAAKILQGEACQ